MLKDRDRLVRSGHDELEDQRHRDRADIGDSLDESTEESIASTQLRLRDREKFLLNKIEEALSRMDEGVYGECFECGEEIAFLRLKARPVAELCIDCKQESERSERSGSGADD